jgi:hypothetical protein
MAPFARTSARSPMDAARETARERKVIGKQYFGFTQDTSDMIRADNSGIIIIIAGRWCDIIYPPHFLIDY